MKLLIFGASGRTGLLLTEKALKLGYEVSVFVRTPEKFPIIHPNLQLIKGNVTNRDAVIHAMDKQDAVSCTLGGKSPFKHAPDLIQGLENIVFAMELKKVKRLIYLSVISIKENRAELGFLINCISPILLKKVIEDHVQKENIICQSQLDWTIVRPPVLTNGRLTGKYKHGSRIKPNGCKLRISRQDLADFMIKEIAARDYIHQKPRILRE